MILAQPLAEAELFFLGSMALGVDPVSEMWVPDIFLGSMALRMDPVSEMWIPDIFLRREGEEDNCPPHLICHVLEYIKPSTSHASNSIARDFF